MPQNLNELEKETQKELELKDAPALSFNDLKNEFHKIFLIQDPGLVKVVCGTIQANRLKADPVWLLLVGASGTGKTEFINSLDMVKGIYTLSTLTSHTFVSGKKGKESASNSLLLRLQNGILAIKDFTSILSMQKDERKEIMGQFREIYDGKFDKTFGTGEEFRWRGKLGLIAGVTTTIYQVRDLYAAMGERFIMYYPQGAKKIEERKNVGRKAMGNVENIIDYRLELQKKAAKFLDHTVKIHNPLPILTQELTEELLDLSEFATRVRSPVDREFYGSAKEITFVHPPEMPTRFGSQLKILALGLAMINPENKVMEEDKQILYNIALSSLPLNRRAVLQELTKYISVNTAALATKLNYPTSTVNKWLEDLNALEVIKRLKSGNKNLWQIEEAYRPIMQKYEGILTIDAELTEDYLQASSGIELSPSAEPDPESSEYASEESYDQSSGVVPLDVYGKSEEE